MKMLLKILVIIAIYLLISCYTDTIRGKYYNIDKPESYMEFRRNGICTYVSSTGRISQSRYIKRVNSLCLESGGIIKVDCYRISGDSLISTFFWVDEYEYEERSDEWYEMFGLINDEGELIKDSIQVIKNRHPLTYVKK